MGKLGLVMKPSDDLRFSSNLGCAWLRRAEAQGVSGNYTVMYKF